MENKINNSLDFNNQEALIVFVRAVIDNKKVNDLTNDFESQNFEKCRSKNKYQKTGMALKSAGMLSNDKLIYDLYRSSKSMKKKVIYYLDQCEGLLNLLGVIFINDIVLLESENKNHELARLFHREKLQSGRPIGSENRQSKSQNLIKEFHPIHNKWNEIVNFIQKELNRHTFSVYYYTEYKEHDPINHLNLIGRVREIKKSLITFSESTFTVFVKDSKNNENTCSGEFTISPVGIVKQVLQTQEFKTKDDSQMTFFFELGIERKFNEFALGYLRETHITNDFRIELAILVKEIDNKQRIEIEKEKFISYRNLHDLPNEVLRSFFEKQSQNYLKPPTVHKEKTFKNLQAEINKFKNSPKDLQLFENDGYVSMPIFFDTPSKEIYDERMEVFDKIKGKITLKNLFYAPSNMSYEAYYLNIKNYMFSEYIENISKSRYFILIVPEIDYKSVERVSKIFLELGVAIYLKRPILIICHINFYKMIPKNVISNDEDIIRYNTIEDINTDKIKSFFNRHPADFF